jgi:hypothetical protein
LVTVTFEPGAADPETAYLNALMAIVAPFAAGFCDAFGLLVIGAEDLPADGFALADADGVDEAAGLDEGAAADDAGAGASAAVESEDELHAALPRQTATTVAIADLR